MGGEQQQVALARPRERRAHRRHLRVAAHQRLGRSAGAAQLVFDDGRHHPALPAAQEDLHLLDEHPIGLHRPSAARELTDRLVVAVAGLADHHRPAGRGQRGGHPGERRQAVGIMGEVHDRGDAAEAPQVGAPGVRARVAAERHQTAPDRAFRQAERHGHPDRAERVREVVTGRPTERERQVADRHDLAPFVAAGELQRVAIEHAGLAAALEMLGERRVGGIE